MLFAQSHSTNYSFANFASSRENSAISPGGTLQLSEAVATCQFGHQTSTVRSVSTPSGVIVVAAGDGFISAATATVSMSTRKPSFVQDKIVTSQSIASPGPVCSMSLHALPSSVDGALGICGTVNGYITIFSVSCAGTGLHPILSKLTDICVSNVCSDFTASEPILSVTVGFDRLWQQEFYACASSHSVCMFSASEKPQVMRQFSVFESEIVDILAPQPPSVDDVSAESGVVHATALYVVLDSQAIQPVMRVEDEVQQQVSTSCRYECTPLVTLAAAADAQNFVNDCAVFPRSSKFNGCPRVVMCGASWWGVATATEPTGNNLGLRQTAVSQRLSLCRPVSDEMIAFAVGSDLLIGSTVEKLGMKQLRPIHSFGSIILDICGVPITGLSTAASGVGATQPQSVAGTGVNPTPRAGLTPRTGVSPVSFAAPPFGAVQAPSPVAFAVAVGSTVQLFLN